MRCNECKVDLGEEYKRCPLCGAASVDAEPQLKGLKTAEYPKYDDEKLLSEKPKKHCDFPAKHLLPVCCAAAVVLAVGAALWYAPLWSVGVPVLYSCASICYLALGLLQKKGTLLYSTEYLIKLAILCVFSLVAGAIAKSGAANMAIALGVCAVSFIILAAVRPVRMKEQLKALFHLS